MYFAIAAVLIFGSMLTISHLNELEESIKKLNFDKEKEMKKLLVNNSLLLMKEKFPNLEIIEHNNRNQAHVEAIARNLDTYNYIRLSLDYDWYDEEVRESVRCRVDDNKFRDQMGYSKEHADGFENLKIDYPLSLLKDGGAQNQYVYDFIRYTNCLEINDVNFPEAKVSTPEYGDIPTYTISVPQGSARPGCEEIAKCFLPEDITIKRGEIIEWKNYDTAHHTITSGSPDVGPTPIFDSGLAPANATYALKFNSIGTFEYFCMVHPWQTGTITVIN